MKRPLAYITAAWSGDHNANTKQAAQYCRAVYEAGFSPVCPMLYLSLFIDNAIPEEHKSGIDIGRDLLRRAHVLVVCGNETNENVKNDIAVETKDGTYTITFTIKALDPRATALSGYNVYLTTTKSVILTIEGSMFEDDFTGNS